MIRSPVNQLQEIALSKRSIRGRLRRAERSALRHAHRFLVQRFANLRYTRRHALGWLFLVGTLVGLAMWQQNTTAQSYSAPIAAESGIYTEGVFGALDNLNPVLASSPAERSASRLLFAQLLRYDRSGDFVGELVRTWRAEQDGKVYVIELRPEARWQDGIAVTADDVVFTFGMIKNADAHSPLYSSWRNIVVEKVDNLTVRFTLPSPYAAFPSSLTIGLLPDHLLHNLQPSELRTAEFNLRPKITNGPFVFEDLSVMDSKQNHILLRLRANSDYVFGKPKLDGFHLHAYKDREDMIRAYRSQEVASLSDATAEQLHSLAQGSFVQTNSPLFNGAYAFLNNASPVLSDARVRQALQAATDQPELLKPFGERVYPLNGPLLPGQLGYRVDVRQPAVDVGRANALLDAAGWARGADGLRQKDGRPLQLRLVTTSSGDFPAIAEGLMNQWQKLGIAFDSQLVKAEDIQQNVIAPRGYDVLIYEIAIGRDPDVYAYWHSSQAVERGLNLSNYRSSKVDEALETARTRPDPTQRDAKYRLFAQQWLSDAPAVALYRPTLTYVQNKNVVTFTPHPLVDQVDRFFNVRSWASGQVIERPTR